MGKEMGIRDFLAAGIKEMVAASTTTIYTEAIKVTRGMFFALWYKATSDGDVILKIELEQSYKLPTTEGSSDADWVVAEGASEIDASLTDENAHIIAVSPVVSPYVRLKITGSSTNHSSTTIKAIMLIQEDM